MERKQSCWERLAEALAGFVRASEKVAKAEELMLAALKHTSEAIR